MSNNLVMDDSKYVGFRDIEDFDAKCWRYLFDKSITCKQYNNYNVLILKRLVSSLTIDRRDDAKFLGVLMWNICSQNMMEIINDGFIIKLDIIEGYVCDVTTYGVWKSFDSYYYYNILKFIGQYTSSQIVYDRCLIMLETLIWELGENVLHENVINPFDMLYLLSFNQNVDTKKNRMTNLYIPGNKEYIFTKSAYHQELSDMDIIYDKYVVSIQYELYRMAKLHNYSSLTMIGFVRNVVQQHYPIIDIDTMKRSIRVCIDNIPFTNKVIRTLIDMSNTPLIPKLNKQSPARSIDDDIVDTLVCVMDDYYNKRKMLITMYNTKFITPNSSYSHDLLRYAVDQGMLWLVKFLISQGVPTQNLPIYSNYPRALESLQLFDILNSNPKDRFGYGPHYMNSLKQERNKVASYLIKYNLI
jgi:hypothetical protein